MAKRKKMRRTAWHPVLAGTLRYYLPKGYELKEEHTLGGHPQRIDVLIVRQLGANPGEPTHLRSILSGLAHHTLIEFKGPTDVLERSDFAALLAYHYRYRVQNKGVGARDVLLIWVADSLTEPFQEALAGDDVALREEAAGVWVGKVGAVNVRVVETGVAGLSQVEERLLLAFSKRWRERSEMFAELAKVDTSAWDAYNEARTHIAFFQGKAKDSGTSGPEEFRDFDAFMEQTMYIFNEAEERIIENMTPERRLRGLSPEERLRGLPAEERLRGLTDQEKEEILRLLLQSQKS